MYNLDTIVKETIEKYLNENLLTEDMMDEFKKKHHKKEDSKDEKSDKEKEGDKESESDKPAKKKKKKFRKNALKGKGGLRKDFDTEEEENYNQNVDDQEQSSVQDLLSNGFVNIKKVAEKLYPDHTPEGAQSQLNKKLRGDKSDSGSTYKLKSKEVKRLRHIIASYLK